MRLRPSLTLKSKWERELYEAEANLTDPDIRQSMEKTEQLLHPEFLETGSSGIVYDRDTMIELMLGEAPGDVIIRDFTVHPLSDDTALVTYRSIGISGQEARRSSIWVEVGDRWQLRYHQGTRVPNSWGHVG
jgi:hypothetical protein